MFIESKWLAILVWIGVLSIPPIVLFFWSLYRSGIDPRDLGTMSDLELRLSELLSAKLDHNTPSHSLTIYVNDDESIWVKRTKEKLTATLDLIKHSPEKGLAERFRKFCMANGLCLLDERGKPTNDTSSLECILTGDATELAVWVRKILVAVFNADGATVLEFDESFSDR